MSDFEKMTYAQFVESVKPSGAINRWPQLGDAAEMVSFSVYMNGPLAEKLPQTVREHEFRDVTIAALTQKLGLDASSARDKLKVAEIVATRHSYMTAVLEASFGMELSPVVVREYALLSDLGKHPEVVKQIEAQKALSQRLVPLLADVEKMLGKSVKEVAAGGVNRGQVLSQNDDFTLQQVGDGKVVAHQNTLLDQVPTVGEDVSVTYYKGRGQVIENIGRYRIKEPHIDVTTGDIGIELRGVGGKVEKVVLFSSMALVAEFAREHDLGKGLVKDAMDLREKFPKALPERAARETEGQAVHDMWTDCIAVTYKEGGLRYTALFRNADDVEANATRIGATAEVIESAKAVEKVLRKDYELLAGESLIQATKWAAEKYHGVGTASPNAEARHAGNVVQRFALHVVQDTGRGRATVHDVRNLERVPELGEAMTVMYRGDGQRGSVFVRDAGKDRGNSR